MALSDKLYTLRKKSGLSQEQLAEQLGVSRQAISKWESGQSTPETDKLISISKFFNVTIDSLVKDETATYLSVNNAPENSNTSGLQKPAVTGLIICLFGLVGLIIWGIITIIQPSTAEQISNSSAITIDGTGILLLLCMILMVIGVVLFLRKNKK